MNKKKWIKWDKTQWSLQLQLLIMAIIVILGLVFTKQINNWIVTAGPALSNPANNTMKIYTNDTLYWTNTSLLDIDSNKLLSRGLTVSLKNTFTLSCAFEYLISSTAPSNIFGTPVKITISLNVSFFEFT